MWACLELGLKEPECIEVMHNILKPPRKISILWTSMWSAIAEI